MWTTIRRLAMRELIWSMCYFITFSTALFFPTSVLLIFTKQSYPSGGSTILNVVFSKKLVYLKYELCNWVLSTRLKSIKMRYPTCERSRGLCTKYENGGLHHRLQWCSLLLILDYNAHFETFNAWLRNRNKNVSLFQRLLWKCFLQK